MYKGKEGNSLQARKNRFRWFVVIALIALLPILAYTALDQKDHLQSIITLGEPSLGLQIANGLIIYFGGSLVIAVLIALPALLSQKLLWKLVKIVTPILAIIGIAGGVMSGWLLVAAPFFILGYLGVLLAIYLVIKIRDRYLLIFEDHLALFNSLVLILVILNFIALGFLLYVEVTYTRYG